jgi:AcrR family transcriptional regulator
MSAKGARTYSSPLRAEQAEQTTARIVQAAVDLLAEGDADDLSMADVAERAGVSVRTVYRSFATRDELLDGVIEWLGERILMRAGPPPDSRESYVRLTPDVIRAVFEIEPLYRALYATRAGRESHRRTKAQRRVDVRGAFAEELATVDDDAARRFSAVLHLVSSSQGALFMKDYWDLDPEEVGRALQWAIAALADAIADPQRREEL